MHSSQRAAPFVLHRELRQEKSRVQALQQTRNAAQPVADNFWEEAMSGAAPQAGDAQASSALQGQQMATEYIGINVSPDLKKERNKKSVFRLNLQ